jgi:hypothetical protein
MTLWLSTVVGSHLSFETVPKNLNVNEIEKRIKERLKEIEIPSPCCDVNKGEEGDCGIAIGSRLPKIDTLYDYDYRHSTLPVLTEQQLSGIRRIAEELLQELKANGYKHDCEITDGLAVHATS